MCPLLNHVAVVFFVKICMSVALGGIYPYCGHATRFEQLPIRQFEQTRVYNGISEARTGRMGQLTISAPTWPMAL